MGQDRVAPSSALPIGAERTLSEMQVVKLDPVNSPSDLSLLLHSVLALIEPPAALEHHEENAASEETPAKEYNDDELLGSTLLGFIHMCVLFLH